MDREREASSSSAAVAVGLRPWVTVLLFSLLILLFLPSSFRGFRLFAIRNGWDTLNVLLVLFAILCGVLSRRRGTDDGDRLPRPAEHGDWHRAHSGYPRAVEASPAAGGLRMHNGGGSCPVLRPSLDAGAEEWRFYGDVQHYRQDSESGAWKRGKFGDSEAKTIAVDTYVERRSRSPPSPPPPTQWLLGSRALNELPERHGQKDEIFEPERPHPPSPLPPERQSRMTRRKRVGKVAEEKEVEQNEIFGQENYHQWLSSPSPPPRHRQPRRSLKKFRKSNVGQNAISEATMTGIPLPAPTKSRHRRRRSVRDVPQWEAEQNPNFLVEKPHTPLLDPPPRLPSPPQLQEYGEEEAEMMVEKTSHKKRRGSGAKDIAAAIALSHPKRKGSKTKISSNDTTFPSEEPASSAPPLPPPLPSSVSHHLFYQKKGGSNTRRIHSESAAPPPPPPMPPPPERQSTQQAMQPPPPGSAPPSHNWHHKGKEKAYLYESPLPPLPPAPPSRSEKSNLSKRTDCASSPMSPLPPPTPPRTPSHFHQMVTDEEVVLVNHNLNRRVVEGQATKAKEREAVAVSCPNPNPNPNPNVDSKADLFIAQCHLNWKLEKQNSIREKERRKQRRQQEAEMGRA
ncbi:uncharacterized protein LOC141828697 [Curcuma longa]|uniref:uncharacterized protein LOC141828697 n=1 Tax=Curcuma longa TaxID=136217 RepID=UPI003D9F8E13